MYRIPMQNKSGNRVPSADMHPCINFSPISFQAKILRKTLLSCSFWVPEIHLTSISASKEVKRRRYVIVKVISWSTLMHKCLAFINLQTEALFEPIISQINWCFHKKSGWGIRGDFERAQKRRQAKRRTSLHRPRRRLKTSLATRKRRLAGERGSKTYWCIIRFILYYVVFLA